MRGVKWKVGATKRRCKRGVLLQSARLMPAPTYAPTVVIENFYPCLEGGRYPVKRIVGEDLEVWVDVF